MQEITFKLAKKAEELKVQPNQLNFSSFLVNPKESGPYINYSGDGDTMATLLENNLNIVQSKIASANEAIFIYKNNWEQIEEKKREVASENLRKLEELKEKLQTLKDVYRSMIVSPGVTIIEDGERENPDCFRVTVEPATSTMPLERERLLKEWQILLQGLEKSVAEPLQLDLRP